MRLDSDGASDSVPSADKAGQECDTNHRPHHSQYRGRHCNGSRDNRAVLIRGRGRGEGELV